MGKAAARSDARRPRRGRAQESGAAVRGPSGGRATHAVELERQRRTIERLQTLVEASKALNSTLDLGELFEITLNMTTQQAAAERASLFLVDAQRKELWTLVAQGLEQKEIRLPFGKGLAGWVAESGETIALEDAYSDPRFDRSVDKASGYRTRTMLVMPVKDRAGRIVAVLQLLNKRQGSFSHDDIELLEGISVHAAIALDNARLHKESLEKQKLERELSLARTIQRGLLPEKPPQLEGYDVAVRHETSLQVGGDYYDFIELSPSTQLFLVADVEGKGAPSALVMSNLQATLHTLVRHVHAIEGILFNLNDRILESTRGGKYMTMFLGLLDLPRRGLHYINAGHVAPVVIRRGSEPIYLREGGMVVGLMPGTRYRRGFMQLEPGDVVLTCTDGITEADNPAEEQYGAARMVAQASSQLHRSAVEIVDAIHADVERFSRGGQHQDDRVLMAIKVG
jgi:sigma-B regulation protein RsbU (phosphoserine phosphatase)